MKKSLLLIFLVVLVYCKQNDHPINEDAVNEIKQKTDSWEAHNPDENPLKDYSHEELHYMLGL